MTLMYRGIAYNQSAACVSSSTMVTGKYRGAEMKIAHSAIAPGSQSRFSLKYRGVPYSATTNPGFSGGLATAF